MSADTTKGTDEAAVAADTGRTWDADRQFMEKFIGKLWDTRSEHLERADIDFGQAVLEAARPVHYREAAQSLRGLLDGLLPIDDRTMGLRYAATRLERTAQDLEGDTDA